MDVLASTVSLIRGLSWMLVALGVAALFAAAQAGQLSVHLVVVVPVVTGTGPLAVVGFLLLFGGLAGLWIARVRTLPDEDRSRQAARTRHREPDERQDRAAGSERQRRSGGVIFLGPIPIVWGSDQETARSMIWLGLALLVLAVLVALFLRWG